MPDHRLGGALAERVHSAQNCSTPSDVSIRLTTEGDRAQLLHAVREAFSDEVNVGQEEVEIVEAIWSLGAPRRFGFRPAGPLAIQSSPAGAARICRFFN